MKYGAWYLNPKTWKKHKEGEPTQAPQTERQENIVSEAKAESKKLVFYNLNGDAVESIFTCISPRQLL